MGGLNFLSSTIFISSFVLFVVCTVVSKWFFRKKSANDEEELGIILGAVLSLLALLIGFTMSMCLSGFRDRQIAEQNEAVAIKTAYIKADLLPNSRLEVRELLQQYLNDRILFYNAWDPDVRQQLSREDLATQTKLWKIAVSEGNDSFVSAVSDLISGYQHTQGAWTYQIPVANWILLIAVGVCSHILLGYQARKIKGKWALLLVMPFMVSLSYFTMSEIDVPGRGIIRVESVNMELLRDNIPPL